MRLFLRKLFWFLVPVIFIIAGSSYVSKAVLFYGDFYKLKPETQYLVLGHSQPECAFNDSLISQTQNFSQGGEAYIYTFQKLKRLTSDNPSVKTVFVSFANNQISERMDKWIWGDESMYNYYPKYSFLMDWQDYETLLEGNLQEVLKSETKSVKNFASFMAKNRKDYLRDRNWGGYLYLDRSKLDSLMKTDYREKESKSITLKKSETNIAYLRKMVDFCKSKGIRVIFFRTPVRPDFPFLKNEQQFQQVRNERFADVEFMDFKNFDPGFDGFRDYDHLNSVGAKRFSLFFDGLLKKDLLHSKDMQRVIDNMIKSPKTKDSISS